MWTNDVAAQIERPRPLIVLDLDDHDAVALARMLTEDGYEDIADQIEAQTKPARIPEPGLWGVVEAGGYRWVRYSLAGYDDWVDLLGKQNEWDVLIDPTLIREGVES